MNNFIIKEKNICGKIINYPMLDIIYRIDVNEYNGREYLDCWVEHYRRRHAEES